MSLIPTLRQKSKKLKIRKTIKQVRQVSSTHPASEKEVKTWGSSCVFKRKQNSQTKYTTSDSKPLRFLAVPQIKENLKKKKSGKVYFQTAQIPSVAWIIYLLTQEK